MMFPIVLETCNVFQSFKYVHTFTECITVVELFWISVCSCFTISFSISFSISGLIFLCRLGFPHLFHLFHSYLGVATGKNKKPLPCTTTADTPSLCCKSNCHFSGTFCNPAQWQHEQHSRSGKVPLSMVLTHAIYLFTGRMKQCNTVFL